MPGAKKEEGKSYSSNWGGARNFKPEAEKRSRNIGIRVTEAELAFLKGKAEELGLSLTDLFLEGVKKL
ncbi:hypothetical protein [Treponema sp.]|uniref:plasmid mobilization protein n=1 Tax=Treponema sp. TaxID=166 RepID=UPI0025FC9306|nr:hypothetical protein [Treponema sp.]MCR5219193.1 hypothetical protein [Treponema sp.]